MDARPASSLIESRPHPVQRLNLGASAWAQQLLLFALFFAGLMLLHAPLLRLPYFWDEAGYYIPAARDLFLTGTLIPQSTPSNAHPPLVMAWLALAWRVFGSRHWLPARPCWHSRILSRGVVSTLANRCESPVAWATTALVALYPVYFTQSSMAQVDLPAAGFTFWALGGIHRLLKTKVVLEARGVVLAGGAGERDCDTGSTGAVWLGSHRYISSAARPKRSKMERISASA